MPKDSGNTAELEVLKKAIEKEKDELLNRGGRCVRCEI